MSFELFAEILQETLKFLHKPNSVFTFRGFLPVSVIISLGRSLLTDSSGVKEYWSVKTPRVPILLILALLQVGFTESLMLPSGFLLCLTPFRGLKRAGLFTFFFWRVYKLPKNSIVSVALSLTTLCVFLLVLKRSAGVTRYPVFMQFGLSSGVFIA